MNSEWKWKSPKRSTQKNLKESQKQKNALL